jgi:transketolase
MDAVQVANSGHPGTPMALAPVAYCLWNRFLQFDPDDPIWGNRDRFVQSMGQGVATSVRMAIAERWMAAHFDRDGFPLFDDNIYRLCGDGDMMEGISHEAASLAGHLRLSHLYWIYDNNITIEGHTELASISKN